MTDRPESGAVTAAAGRRRWRLWALIPIVWTALVAAATLWLLEQQMLEASTDLGTLAGGVALCSLGLALMWVVRRRLHGLEAALHARREWSDLAQALPLTVFRYEQPAQGRGRFSFIGRGVERLFGVDAQVLDDDPALPWRLAGDEREQPPRTPVEFKVRRTNGRATWVRAHSTPAAAADGSTVYNGYWLDVTANREAESRFEAVFQHATSAYLFFDRQRGITDCNPATLAMFRARDPAHVLGSVPWFPGLSPERQADGRTSREHALELMRRHLRSAERVQSCEWRFCRLDGETFDAEVNVIALAWEREPQFCAVITDISARKHTEQAMLEARAAAEAASQTKSNFLANMSHELRTPMNAIIGMTHLALDDGLPPRQRGYVEKAHGAARNLLRILDGILDVSKVESGQLELERIEFDLDVVIEETADVLGLRAEEKGLELLFSAAPNIPRLIGDPTRLRQVLVNLGSNAIKFTERGEVMFGIEPMALDADSIELHGWVRDTGVGLTPEQQARIFQPFIQADSSTTRRFGGTGLGLTICRELVAKMDGRLWVDSVHGRGSTFHFSARFSRAAAPHERVEQRLQGRRALVVDDNPSAREVLALMLGDLGISVEQAESGTQALERLADSPARFAWVLMDWKMQGMDGVACAKHMLERYADVRPSILLVTAFARDDAMRAAAGLPLAGVLTKPVTPSRVEAALVDALQQRTPAALLAAEPPPARRTEARSQLKGARVLLVEDNPLNQELARELLQRAGIEVVAASDGQQGLDALERDGPFDGVLMDCQMPVMDGYTATRKLRANPAWRDLPVIAMTASALAADREKALASGMNAHISKPLDVDRMFRTLAEWIAPHEAPPPPLDDASRPLPISGFGALEHVDAQDGLQRCMGNAELFRRLLRAFADAQRGFEAMFVAARERGDDARAQHLAHELKGASGAIGAHELHAAAQRLQEACAARNGVRIADTLDSVLDELLLVLAEIDAALSEESTAR